MNSESECHQLKSDIPGDSNPKATIPSGASGAKSTIRHIVAETLYFPEKTSP